MYIFKPYVNDDAQANNGSLQSFPSKNELFDYLDQLCKQQGIPSQINKNNFLITFLNSDKVRIGEEVYDGYCLSEMDDKKRKHLLGYWAKKPCEND